MFGIFGGCSEDPDEISQTRREFMETVTKATGSLLIPTSNIDDSDLPSETDLEKVDSIDQIDLPSSDYITAIKSLDDPRYHDAIYPDGLFIMTKSENNITDSDRIRIPVNQMDGLPDNHPLNTISEVIPDVSTTPSILEEDTETISREERIRRYDEIGEKLERGAGNWDEAWEMLKEDAEAVSSTEISYIDERELVGSTHYIEIPLVNNLELEDELENGFYSGEKFDCWIYRENEENSGLYDRSALIISKDHRFISPERILSNDEYEEVLNGETSPEEFEESDKKVLAQLYTDSERERQDYEFNFI